jgi:hypothetical protein
MLKNVQLVIDAKKKYILRYLDMACAPPPNDRQNQRV